jgi:hypothetical protein
LFSDEDLRRIRLALARKAAGPRKRTS